MFKNRRDSAKPVMENLKVLDVNNLNIFQVLNFMYKFTKKQLPSNFDNYFSLNNSSRFNLRSSRKGNFILPKNSSKYVEHSLSYRGPKLWNTLCTEIKISKNLNTFKNL